MPRNHKGPLASTNYHHHTHHWMFPLLSAGSLKGEKEFKLGSPDGDRSGRGWRQDRKDKRDGEETPGDRGYMVLEGRWGGSSHSPTSPPTQEVLHALLNKLWFLVEQVDLLFHLWWRGPQLRDSHHLGPRDKKTIGKRGLEHGGGPGSHELKGRCSFHQAHPPQTHFTKKTSFLGFKL